MVLKDTNLTLNEGYEVMKHYMLEQGFTIFLETKEMVTIRGKFPKGHKNEGITGDFVLARKEVGYEEGTRRPILEIGDLWDDLVRRDFSINAMAEDEEGNIIDYFNGKEDLNDRLLRTPQPALVTFNDDPLRLLRALRFKITKRLYLSVEIRGAMANPDILYKLKEVVSQERIREEVLKMMKYDTIETIKLLTEFKLLHVCFGGEMWLKPTFENK